MLLEIGTRKRVQRTAGAPYRDLPRDALLLLRSLRDRPRDAGPWGEPAFAREVDRIRAQLAPIRDRRGLAASYGREAFRRPRTRPAPTPSPRPRASRAAPTRSAGSSSGTAPAARHGPSSSPTWPDAAEAPRPLSFADASLPALLHAPCATIRPMPRCRRTACSSGRAMSASSAPASTRCCRSASASTTASSRSSARSRTRSAARRWRCRSSIRPTSGARAAGTTQSARSSTRFKDRNGRDMVLAMTHEEVVALLLADVVKSWRQLPLQVYHFQTKWRDEPRARGGLDPRPRVRDEGRLQLRPRRGRPRRQLLGPARRLRPDLRAARPRRRSRSAPTSG